jgi:hypothetical protein
MYQQIKHCILQNEADFGDSGLQLPKNITRSYTSAAAEVIYEAIGFFRTNNAFQHSRTSFYYHIYNRPSLVFNQ